MLINPYILASGSGLERTPMQMAFTSFLTQPIFDPQPLRAEVTDLIETFASTADIEVTTTKYGGTAGTASVAGNILTISGGDNTAVLAKTSVSSFTVPDAFIEVGIDTQGTSGSQDILEVGIFLDGSAFVTGSIDRVANTAWIQVTNPSSDQRVAQVSFTVPSGAFRLGFGYMQNAAAMYVDTGSGWTYVTGGDTSAYLNLNAPSTLTDLRAGFILASASPTTWKFDKLRSGRFGAVGFRDPTLVTNKGGTPYINAGKAYVTASTTLAFTSGGGGGATHNSIHEIDLSTMEIEMVGVFYNVRSSVFRYDLNLHIVDNGDGTQELFWATWGDSSTSGGIRMVHSAFTGAYQFGTRVMIPAPTYLALPGLPSGASGSYDGMAAWDGAQWRMAYAIVNTSTSFSSNFWPAQATSSDLSTWTLVGADTGHAGFEGTKLLKAAGQFWTTAGGPFSGTKVARVYDDTMAYQGDLPATMPGSTSNDTRGHAMIFPYGSYQYMITFDDTRWNSVNFTWGQYIVQRSPRYT